MDILRLDLRGTKPDAPTEGEVRFQIALLSAIATTAVSLLARFVFDAPLIPELLAQTIFAILPISLIAAIVSYFGLFAKHLAFLLCVLVYLAAFTTAAYFFLGIYKPDKPGSSKVYQLAVYTVTLWLVATIIVIPLLGGGFLGGLIRQGVFITMLTQFIVSLTSSLFVHVVAKFYLREPETIRANSHRFSRRSVLRGVGLAVLGVGIYDIGQSLIKTWFQFTSGRVKNGDGIFPNLNGLALEVTPTKDFYQVSKNPFDPELSAAAWKLEVGGLVGRPLTLTYEDLLGFDLVEQYATLACIDNPVGGNLIGNALWRGVRLKDLLESASLREGIIDIVFRAADGYADSIPLERAMSEGTILAFHMNGEPLTPTHGFPLRLLVPGIFGMKNVKWITRIEAVDFDFKGYWQRRGWDDRAEYKTLSRIDAPATKIKEASHIAGIAFAGDRGISRVEISTDGGKTWEPAELKPSLSRYSWILWYKEWAPRQAGKYNIKVRATDGRGEIQTSQNAPPDPSGATGHHSITIESD